MNEAAVAFCLWDIPALAFVIAIIIVIVVKESKSKHVKTEDPNEHHKHH